MLSALLPIRPRPAGLVPFAPSNPVAAIAAKSLWRSPLQTLSTGRAPDCPLAPRGYRPVRVSRTLRAPSSWSLLVIPPGGMGMHFTCQ